MGPDMLKAYQSSTDADYSLDSKNIFSQKIAHWVAAKGQVYLDKMAKTCFPLWRRGLEKLSSSIDWRVLARNV